MTNNVITKEYLFGEVGEKLPASFTSNFIKLDNYKRLDFVLAITKGEAQDVAVKIVGKDNGGESFDVPFKLKNESEYELYETPLTIQSDVETAKLVALTVTVDQLAKLNADEVAINIIPETADTLSFSCVGIAFYPRYTK